MIEQPQSKSNLRRSRSPSSHRKHSDQNGMGMLAGNGVDSKGQNISKDIFFDEISPHKQT